MSKLWKLHKKCDVKLLCVIHQFTIYCITYYLTKISTNIINLRSVASPSYEDFNWHRPTACCILKISTGIDLRSVAMQSYEDFNWNRPTVCRITILCRFNWNRLCCITILWRFQLTQTYGLLYYHFMKFSTSIDLWSITMVVKETQCRKIRKQYLTGCDYLKCRDLRHGMKHSCHRH